MVQFIDWGVCGDEVLGSASNCRQCLKLDHSC